MVRVMDDGVDSRCPQTDQRLVQVSQKLKKFASEENAADVKSTNHVSSPRTKRSIEGRVATPLPGSRSRPAPAGLKPPSHPAISNLRRSSLTGSLPDLSEATEEDVQQGRQLLGADSLPHRPPLPAGSDDFSRALQGGASNVAVPILNLRELREKARSGSPIHRFRSRTAEAIHMSRFGKCFPQYLEKLSRDHPDYLTFASFEEEREASAGPDGQADSDNREHLPEISQQNPMVTNSSRPAWAGSHDNIHLRVNKHVSWGDVGVSTYVKGSIVHRSMPNSPRPPRKQFLKEGILFKQNHMTDSSDENSAGSSPTLARSRSLRTSRESLISVNRDTPRTQHRILNRKQMTNSLSARTSSED